MMSFFTILLLAGMAYIAYTFFYKNWKEFKNADATVKAKGFIVFLADTFKPLPNIIEDPEEIAIKKGVGFCDFYNEVDHTRGKFHYYYKTESDKHDPRKAEYFRIRYSVDAKMWGFLPAWKTYNTRCVFRPGVDTDFISPGQECGISEDGLVVIKKSMDGMRLSSSTNNVTRHKLFDAEHQLEVMANFHMLTRDKERFTSYKPTSEEFMDELEGGIKNLRKLEKRESTPGGDPYARAIYDTPGLETGEVTPGGGDGGWNMGDNS